MNYNRAVQVTAREEMLLNLIRMRYHQSVDFLRIPSITSQYRYASSLGGSRQWSGGTSSSIAVGGNAETKPTIVYAPEQEQEFNKRLFTPISLETLDLMSSKGWAIDRVLRLAVKEINGVNNAISAGGPTPEHKPEFEEFVYMTSALRQLQLLQNSEPTLELVLVEKSSEPKVRSAPIPVQLISPQDYITAEAQGLVWNINENDRTAVLQTQTTTTMVPKLLVSPRIINRVEFQEFAKILGLKPDATEYSFQLDTEGQLKHPRFNEDGTPAPQIRTDLTLSTRSLYEMMFYVSHSIEVPCEHLERGLVRMTFDSQGNAFDWNEMTKGLFHVKMSKRRPADSAVAVKHRGYWFYIEANDLDSKSTFNLILELFNLEIRAGGGAQIPLLTL